MRDSEDVPALEPSVSPNPRATLSLVSLPGPRGRVIAALVVGLGVPLVGFIAWYLASNDLVIESADDLVVPGIVLGAMLVLSALVGWLLHGAARRAVNRARVETALAVDQQFVGRMQRTLLPLQLPHVEHIELEARYHPAHDGARGGDWYAAIPLGEGRVGLAVGEVDGEGAGASARMAEARISLRALAADGAEPHVVLERLNEHLFTAGDEGAPVTAVYGILDAVSRRWVQSVAGECSPIVHEPDKPVVALEGKPGPALGVERHVMFVSQGFDIPAGGTVLLFSDGFLARGGELRARDLRRLGAALRVFKDDLTEAVDRLLRLMIGDQPEDDVVVLAARLEEVPAPIDLVAAPSPATSAGTPVSTPG